MKSRLTSVADTAERADSKPVPAAKAVLSSPDAMAPSRRYPEGAKETEQGDPEGQGMALFWKMALLLAVSKDTYELCFLRNCLKFTKNSPQISVSRARMGSDLAQVFEYPVQRSQEERRKKRSRKRTRKTRRTRRSKRPSGEMCGPVLSTCYCISYSYHVL